jgi:transposase
MWLVRRLAPHFKTIADFRRRQRPIVGTCRAFVLFCPDQGLFKARLIALNGSKFRATLGPVLEHIISVGNSGRLVTFG